MVRERNTLRANVDSSDAGPRKRRGKIEEFVAGLRSNGPRPNVRITVGIVSGICAARDRESLRRPNNGDY